jgi:hypothetical protein
VFPAHIDLKAEYELKEQVDGYMCAVQRITPERAEMDI